VPEPLDDDLHTEIDGLRYEITAAKRNCRDFAKRHFNTTRENALIFCLARAAETAEGCDLLAGAKLVTPVHILTRSLLESLFWVCWIVQSDENAQAFADASRHELRRIARKSLRTGAARVTDRATGEDKTKEFLESDWFNGIPGRLRMEDLAKASGLGRIYTQFYSTLSMQAHGAVYQFELASADAELLSVMAMANALLECINFVVKSWIERREHIRASQIYAILMPQRQQGG
jgi:hypothetical protein